MHSLVDNFETERHVRAGIAIRYRKDIDQVNVFPALKNAPDSGGQSPHHTGCINVSYGLGQS